MFTPKVREKLKFYVYLYVDPRDDSVFYVGKGKGNPEAWVSPVRAGRILYEMAGVSSEVAHEALRLDPERHRCTVDGLEIPLTAKEFSLLRGLMRRPGRVMTRDQLLDEVWGSDINVTRRTIDTHLKRLREKLGAAGDYVETVRGVGYRFSG